jgi:hypothetical protein
MIPMKPTPPILDYRGPPERRSEQRKNLHWPSRSARAVNLIALLCAFAVPIIAAGHGAGPIGLLLFFGAWDAWGSPLNFGWLGIICLGASCFASGRLYLCVAAASLALLGISWVLFYEATESVGLTIATSLPLLIIACGSLVFLGFQARDHL